MALICNRHSFEYAENVCSSCGIAFCHDCLVYPRGPKKPPLCVQCAIAVSGVRSSARNQSNLSRREVKKRVREAKGLQQPQPYVEAPAAANPDRDFELTSNATFDQGWAVSWDEGRDPHPGYPEPVRVSWGNDPYATHDAAAHELPAAAAPGTADATPVVPYQAVTAPPPPVADSRVAALDADAPEPTEPRAGLPRLQPVDLARAHGPARLGGLPSVRPPLKPAGSGAGPPARQPLAAQPPAPTKLARHPNPDAPPPTKPSGRLRRKEKDEGDPNEMLGWLDDLLGSEKGPRGS